jgi:hypothetical protein
MFIEKLSLAEAAPAVVNPPHQPTWLTVPVPPLTVNSAAAHVAGEFDASPYQIVLRFGTPELYTVD